MAAGLSLWLATATWADDKPQAKPTKVGSAEFKVPGDWVAQQPKRQFRILQWGVPTAEGDETAPVIYVSELPGTAGGVKGNIDRWIGEYESKEGKEKTETFEADGIKIHTLAVTGTFMESMGGPFSGGKKTPRENYQTLGAIIEIPDSANTYFFKMVGPKKSVAAQKDAFVAMLKSAKKKG
jgi:gluconolactonase